MIIVTGGAGFIGSCLIRQLNQKGLDNIYVVDHIEDSPKWLNLPKANICGVALKQDFLAQLRGGNFPCPQMIVHLGACSSTMEQDMDYMVHNNFQYSAELLKFAVEHEIPFLYASSAATYGDGSRGFDDRMSLSKLRPINRYGYSKHLFDCWASKYAGKTPWYGLKFFNVFGPNEYHKESMASLAYKGYQQAKSSGKIRLFRSYNSDCADGEQSRDFIYVHDACQVILHFMEAAKSEQSPPSGLYNVGTGISRSFKDLALSIFKAMDLPPNIEWIEMPPSIRDSYQYFTQADTEKLSRIGGFSLSAFGSLESRASEYVRDFLAKKDPFY